MIEKSRADIQNLAAMNLKPGVSTINKEMEQRIAKELFTAISSFQKAQRLFAEKQKRRMEHEQRKLNEMLDDAEPWASNATSSPAAEPTRVQSQEQSHVTHTG
ncbi:hypothetical protein QFC19_006294 [Naganishia cerealis]|uniref:Uncharacterized protein n=1 Tax=Naganishia cerealis TaxID=610337 RepID=A0ACC2VHG5_9TREE|nr:hypothetical protein QFC19_006294 [Naganishia cerealis]